MNIGTEPPQQSRVAAKGSRCTREGKETQLNEHSRPTSPSSAMPREAVRLRPWPRKNVLQQPWTIKLLNRMDQHMRENASSGRMRREWRYRIRRILVHAENAGLTDERQITPAWLASIPPQSTNARINREGRTLFGRIFVKLAIWSSERYVLLGENLAVNDATRADKQTATRESSPNPPKGLCELVFKLAQRCGLATGEIQALRVSNIHPFGLDVVAATPRVRRRNGKLPKRQHTKLGRRIPFGDGADEIAKDLIEAHVIAEHPADFLFFSRSPRDKRKPISRQTLEAAVKSLEGKCTIRSLRERHFGEDFSRFSDLRALRFHWRNVHGLSNVHVHQLICGIPERNKGFVAESMSFPVPEPYLVAAICSSGVLPNTVTIRRGATERSSATWTGLRGRYSVTVDWPTDFVKQLRGRGRTSDRALRVLFLAAWDQWYSCRLMKPHHIGAPISEDRMLLEGFSKTRVEVLDTERSATWSGSLLEFRNRKKTCYVPLIEIMNGAAWRNQCKVCMHPERAAIDQEIRQALEKEGRIKGLKRIATTWGVSYQPLMRHAGKKPSVPGRGEIPRSHLGSEIKAPLVSCPRTFPAMLNQLAVDALIVFPMILCTAAMRENAQYTLSETTVEKSIGTTLTENQLSLALANLRNRGLVSDFDRVPNGFRVEMRSPN
jgi:hypothetical protein